MEILMPEPQIYVERTLAIIKPDVIDKEEEIEDLILRSGFHIIQKRKLQLSPEQCSNFYAEQFGKVFFPNLTAYMSSGPIVAMVLARNCAVSYWKELLGPSNSLRARITHPHSLRALYGTDELRNGLHGSLSISSAEKEIRFVFPEAILEPVPTGQRARDYLNLYVKPTLLAGLTALCKEKPADPMNSSWNFAYRMLAVTCTGSCSWNYTERASLEWMGNDVQRNWQYIGGTSVKVETVDVAFIS